MTRKMGFMEWSYHEEKIATLPGMADIGIGDDLVRKSGLPGRELGEVYRLQIHDFIDGGANLTRLHLPDGDLIVYVRRRGRSVDIGTRADFEALGWGMLCDELDRTQS